MICENERETKQDAPSGLRDTARPEKWKPLFILGAGLSILVLSMLFRARESFMEVGGWIDSLGTWAPVVFAVVATAAIVATFPGSIVTIAAATLFGPFPGIIIASIVTTTGATIAFILGRYFARDATERWLGDGEKFRLMQMLTEEHGPTMVALVRLIAAFPFNLVNYALAMTKVNLKTYVFWTWLCMLPYIVVYALWTDIIVKELSGQQISFTLLAMALVITAGLVLVVRHARQILREIKLVCLEKKGIDEMEERTLKEDKERTRKENKEITSFVRETLGCNCPDEVFREIDCQMDVGMDDGITLLRKIDLGNRLLVYVVEEGPPGFVEENIPVLVEAGRTDRDARGFNRFRLVIVTDRARVDALEETTRKEFEGLDDKKIRDDKVHLHVVDRETVKDI